MKNFSTAKDVLTAGQKAVVVFTRGEKLGFDDGGYGGTGNWKTNLTRLETVDKVIIYLRENGQSGGRIYMGNYVAYAPSPQPDRYIIYFSHLKEVGSTTSTWPEFGSYGQTPVAFVGVHLDQVVLDRAFEDANIEIGLKDLREETEDVESHG